MPQSLRHRNGIPRKAFTLIELLVVVAIIALLISILLPSLSRAREQSRAVVCLATERSIGQGLHTYTTDNKEWLPGPNTSGKMLSVQKGAYVFKMTPGEPTQNEDWISPIMSKIFRLPADRSKRVSAILNTELKCPSNRVLYNQPIFGSVPAAQKLDIDPYQTSYSSYTSVAGFHVIAPMLGATETRLWDSVKSMYPAEPDGIFDVYGGTSNYSPRINKVGPPATKVFVTEGARYTDGDKVSFNQFVYQIQGGNFLDYGPMFWGVTGSPYKRDVNNLNLKVQAKRYAYRHFGNLNAVFFDGHAQVIKDREALRSVYWVPKGYVVREADPLRDPYAKEGDVIP